MPPLLDLEIVLPQTLYPMTHRLFALTFTALFCLGVSACTRSTELSDSVSNISLRISPDAININTASTEELQRIPHVGESLAARIIEHREKHGAFRKVEHLMLIQGISDKRFRKIRPLVRVE